MCCNFTAICYVHFTPWYEVSEQTLILGGWLELVQKPPRGPVGQLGEIISIHMCLNVGGFGGFASN